MFSPNLTFYSVLPPPPQQDGIPPTSFSTFALPRVSSLFHLNGLTYNRDDFYCVHSSTACLYLLYLQKLCLYLHL